MSKQKSSNEICGTCKHHYRSKEGFRNDWCCTNDASDYCTDYTEYSHTCEEWEGRNADK